MKRGDRTVKIPTHQLIPIAGLAIGVVFLVIGVSSFGFWNGNTNTPTEGFFPIIIATLLCVLSIVAFFQNIRKPGEEYSLRNWYVPIAFLLFMAGVCIIGTVPAVILFEILWCRFYEKLNWKTTVIALIFCLILVVPIFTMWLQIDFPIGVIGNLVMGY